MVDPNEPPMLGKFTTEQVKNFAEAVLNGDPGQVAVVKRRVDDFARDRDRKAI